MLIACATHWYLSILYFTPVFGFVGWLSVVTYREKRREEKEENAELLTLDRASSGG